MTRLAVLAVALLLAACASNQVAAPLAAGAKTLTQRAYVIETDYTVALKDALALVRTPGVDPGVSQGVQNAVADCGRVFDQLDKAAAAMLEQGQGAGVEKVAALSTNLDDWIARADRSLKNLHAMMRAKPEKH